MNKDSKIYIAGHRGLVGSAILRVLKNNDYTNLLTLTHQELDLTRQKDVELFFEREEPEYVILAAAKVGGIGANDKYSADFIRENLYIETNVISSAAKFNVKKLLFLGSSCIYPKFAKQPISEDELLNGKLESTNIAYALAKIAGIVLCQSYNKQYNKNFITAMPTNLYGPGDNYDLVNSHVLPALIHKIYLAKKNLKKEVVLWGTGTAKREFLYSDELAKACLFLMQNYNDSEIINVGSGEETSINELAHLIKKIIGFDGEIKYDKNYPDGTPRKFIDSTKINKLGWKNSIKLEDGIMKSYKDFLDNYIK